MAEVEENQRNFTNIMRFNRAGDSAVAAMTKKILAQHNFQLSSFIHIV